MGQLFDLLVRLVQCAWSRELLTITSVPFAASPEFSADNGTHHGSHVNRQGATRVQVIPKVSGSFLWNGFNAQTWECDASADLRRLKLKLTIHFGLGLKLVVVPR